MRTATGMPRFSRPCYLAHPTSAMTTRCVEDRPPLADHGGSGSILNTLWRIGHESREGDAGHGVGFDLLQLETIAGRAMLSAMNARCLHLTFAPTNLHLMAHAPRVWQDQLRSYRRLYNIRDSAHQEVLATTARDHGGARRCPAGRNERAAATVPPRSVAALVADARLTPQSWLPSLRQPFLHICCIAPCRRSKSSAGPLPTSTLATAA